MDDSQLWADASDTYSYPGSGSLWRDSSGNEKTKLYAKNGEYPKQLPHMIRLSNGKVRSDHSTFTEQEIINAGYVEVENPPVTEYPSKLEWDGVNL